MTISYRNFKDELPAQTYLHLFRFYDKISSNMSLLARYEGISEIQSLHNKYDAYRFILDNDSSYYVKCSDVIDGTVEIKWIPFNELNSMIEYSIKTDNLSDSYKGVITSMNRLDNGILRCKMLVNKEIEFDVDTNKCDFDDDISDLAYSMFHNESTNIKLKSHSLSDVPVYEG